MKDKLRIFLITGLVLAGIIFLVSQEAEAQLPGPQKGEEVLRTVKSQPVSSAFYEAWKTDESSKSALWSLAKAFSVRQNPGPEKLSIGDFEALYMMEFQNGNSKIIVSIFEYDSPEKASKFLNEVTYSQGSMAASKEFGDEGLNGFNGGGQFIGMRFRKGKFSIYISCKSEELLKSFAGYALKAIAAE